jgi:hypothetical protein
MLPTKRTIPTTLPTTSLAVLLLLVVYASGAGIRVLCTRYELVTNQLPIPPLYCIFKCIYFKTGIREGAQVARSE